MANAMLDRLLKLKADGAIQNTAGEYSRKESFYEDWAQINWYRYYPIMFWGKEFAIRTDVSWKSASETANWFDSGCGFVFSWRDNDNHYLAALTLDGKAHINRIHEGRFDRYTSDYYGKLDIPSGTAELMLVVTEDWIQLYVNGERVTRMTYTNNEGGLLAYTVLSGTNKGFGTRCIMENVDLWMFGEGE